MRVLLTLLLFLLPLSFPLQAQPKRWNILAIKTDDQAEWSLGCYGNKESKSPAIDKLASEGALYKNAFVVTPVCSPSRATYMSGLHSTQVGIPDWITPAQGKAGLGLDPAVPTWPKLLQKAGYRTGLVGKWHLGNQEKFHPLKNGFDFFNGHLDGGWDPKDPVWEIEGKPAKLDGYSVEKTADSAMWFLDQAKKDKPFALCVHFREPHTPYVPMPEDDVAPFKDLDPTIPKYPNLKIDLVKKWTKEYYACVHAIDRSVARILAKLDEMQLADDTIVIFTSDHGYNIGHHGIHTKGNGNWCTTTEKGVRPNMWDTSLRIPLIIKWPGIAKPGTVIEDWATNQDMLPTILAMTGLEKPKDWKGEGIDLSKALKGEAGLKREVLFGQYDITNTAKQRMRMVRTKDWKLVRHYDALDQDELFDLNADPGELKNLYKDDSKKTVREELQAKLEGWMKAVEGERSPGIRKNVPAPPTQLISANADDAKFITSKTFPEMKLIRIPAGKFTMGSPKEEQFRITKTFFGGQRPDWLDRETQHQVTLTKDFYLGEHTVTVAQWRAFQKETGHEAKAGAAPSFKQEDDHPVVNVSYDDAKAFCEWLSKKDGRTYRLPTEAQWEYSCRAKTTTTFHFGDKLNGKEANCDGNNPFGTEEKGPYLGRTTKVGSYHPNAFGLYDMHGNAWQWCADWYGEYPAGSVTDPEGAARGSFRVLRGGGWGNEARSCRSGNRSWHDPSFRIVGVGFRLAVPLP